MTTKTTFSGQHRFVNTDTGEVIDAQVVTKVVGDAGFHKLWVGQILDLVEQVGNAKMKVLMWLLAQADSQNQVWATWKEVAEATGTSRPTVARLMATLRDANVITEVRRSVWRLNPDVIFKGGHDKRMAVMIKFRAESAQADLFDQTAPAPMPRHLRSVGR
jgi:DNA-binding transcriptional ArsR family regulator